MKGAKVLSKQEIKTLLSVCRDQRERMLILVGLYLGTRISETVSLTFGDFTGETVRIKSLKNSNDRLLIIPDVLRAELDGLREHYIEKGCPVSEATPLFLSQKRARGACKAMGRERACKLMKALRDRAGLDKRVSAHSLRKNFTTRIFELTQNNLPQTAIYTGHKSLDCLRAYIQTTEETILTGQLGWI